MTHVFSHRCSYSFFYCDRPLLDLHVITHAFPTRRSSVLFGGQHAADPAAALERARQHAWVMASEVLASGVDLSFAPVVDLGRGNLAIGDRAFSEDPPVVAEFTRAYTRGMHASGMAAPNKHSPGHGTVRDDPHFDAAPHPPT